MNKCSCSLPLFGHIATLAGGWVTAQAFFLSYGGMGNYSTLLQGDRKLVKISPFLQGDGLLFKITATLTAVVAQLFCGQRSSLPDFSPQSLSEIGIATDLNCT